MPHHPRFVVGRPLLPIVAQHDPFSSFWTEDTPTNFMIYEKDFLNQSIFWNWSFFKWNILLPKRWFCVFSFIVRNFCWLSFASMNLIQVLALLRKVKQKCSHVQGKGSRQKKQGMKTSVCERIVFKWSLRSFIVIPSPMRLFFIKSFFPE